MDAGGEVSQLRNRRVGVGHRAVEQLAGSRLFDPLARELELDLQRDEPLLRAVVQIAGQAPALGVARLDDPRPRRA